MSQSGPDTGSHPPAAGRDPLAPGDLLVLRAGAFGGACGPLLAGGIVVSFRGVVAQRQGAWRFARRHASGHEFRHIRFPTAGPLSVPAVGRIHIPAVRLPAARPRFVAVVGQRWQWRGR